METNSIVLSSSVLVGRSLSTHQELEIAQKNQLKGVSNSATGFQPIFQHVEQ